MNSDLPRAPESVTAIAGMLADNTLHHITHHNAMRHFQYDPFAHFPRNECTGPAAASRCNPARTRAV